MIILSYNSQDYLIDCLDSVLIQSYESIEIVIVDNASTDRSWHFAENAASNQPSVAVIRNMKNLGFAGGMNKGVRHTKGDYILFLNADLVLQEDYITRAILAFTIGDTTIGIVGGRAFQWIEKTRTSNLDSGPIILRKRFSHAIAADVENPSFVFGPAGSCPVVSRRMLDDIKLRNGDYFDSDYFMYSEDTDLWLRAHLRGWKCRYEPQAIAWHVRAGSVGAERRLLDRPLQAQRWAMRNRWLTILKDLPGPVLLRLSPYLFLVELATPIYLFIRSPHSLLAWFQALVDLFIRLPTTFEKRRFIQSHRTADAKELFSFFEGF